MPYSVKVGDRITRKAMSKGKTYEATFYVHELTEDGGAYLVQSRYDWTETVPLKALEEKGYHKAGSKKGFYFVQELIKNDPEMEVTVHIRTGMQGSDITDNLLLTKTQLVTLSISEVENLAKEVVMDNIEWSYTLPELD